MTRNTRGFLLLACLLAVAGCSTLTTLATEVGITPAEQAAVARDITVACQIDQAAQPALAGLLVTLPAAAGAVSVDQALVHPAVLAACGALGGTPAVPASTTPAS